VFSLNFKLNTTRYVHKAFLSPWSWLKFWLGGMSYRPTLSFEFMHVSQAYKRIKFLIDMIQRQSRSSDKVFATTCMFKSNRNKRILQN